MHFYIVFAWKLIDLFLSVWFKKNTRAVWVVLVIAQLAINYLSTVGLAHVRSCDNQVFHTILAKPRLRKSRPFQDEAK